MGIIVETKEVKAMAMSGSKAPAGLALAAAIGLLVAKGGGDD